MKPLVGLMWERGEVGGGGGRVRGQTLRKTLHIMSIGLKCSFSESRLENYYAERPQENLKPSGRYLFITFLSSTTDVKKFEWQNVEQAVN